MFCVRASVAAFSLICFAVAVGQTPAKSSPLTLEGYIQPPKEIADAALAPWYKNASVTNISPDHRLYVVTERDGMPSLAALGKEHVNLGGVQVDVAANRARDLTTRSAKGLRIVQIEGGHSVSIPLRPDARVSDPVWSHDSKQIAFLAHFLDRTEIWVANASDGKCHAVTNWPVLATFVTTLTWIGQNDLVTVLVPKNRAHLPTKPPVATTPKVKVTDGKPTAIRTYPSLLQNPFEQEQLEYYTTGQLAVVDTLKGKVTPIGKPAMIRSVDPAPDGKFFHVTVMEKPFSYIFPVSNFPQHESIWDDLGTETVSLNKRGMQGGDGPGSGAGGRGLGAARRNLAWRPDGNGLSFIQVQPAPEAPSIDENENTDEQGRRGAGGFGARGAAGAAQGPQRPDQVMQWLPPFGTKDAKVIFTAPAHINSLTYSSDMKSLFLEQTFATKSRISVVKLDDPTHPKTLVETGADEDPVLLATKPGPITGTVARTSTDGKYAYLTGTKISKDPQKEAPRPFIERVDLGTGKRESVFESKADVFEQPSLFDDDAKSLLVVRQSPTMVPNSFLVTGGQETKLTNNSDFAPDLTQARRETITVTRQDGFKFEVKVTLPKYFTLGSHPPAFFWFYPSEFATQDAYNKSKRAFNKNLFAQVGGANKAILTRLGYTVVEPDCPIVGPAERKNDEYVPQLRNNLAATIDELDRRGWIDRSRLGIGGHSYGAFSTANAMVNTPFFKAGIAGDGNFNRTLTPFGFQTDDRQLWDGRSFYLEMSPFLFAERMTGALLMYHGMEDQNVGTDPINSERMFDAMEALGKTAALYKYPYEDHGQVAQETILDQWARFVAWLDKYVKNGK